jgi:ABC-type transport system involved in multi-copper enzyme maturation permease subunit
MATPVAAPQPTGGWLLQLTRLTGWELFLAWRRRAMVITLSSLLLGIYAIFVVVIGLLWVLESPDTPNGQNIYTQFLVYPEAITIAGGIFTLVGVLLLMVLVGALIGSDYAYGVHRLSLARGVGRGQLLTAQIVALALLALISSAVMVLLGAIIGGVGSALLGGGSALSLGGLGQLALYWLMLALNAFAFALIGLSVGTLGRSVAAAIAGPLVYIFVEYIATEALFIAFQLMRPGPSRDLVAAIPQYFLGFNTNALIQLSLQGPYHLDSSPSQVSWLHALVVVAFYGVALISAAYISFRVRDVRE